MHAISISFFYFLFLFIYLFIYFYIFWGWVQLSPAGPTESLAQASDSGHCCELVTLGTVASMRELFTHACNSCKVIILPLHSNKWNEFAK